MVRRTLTPECKACGWRGLPQRLWCPDCGADDWALRSTSEGEVQATTLVTRRLGARIDPPAEITLIRLAGGSYVIGGSADMQFTDPE